MQIIDKLNDYYDYLQFEFGSVDKDSTFDRRGSSLLTKEDFFKYCYKDEITRFFSYVKNRQINHFFPYKYINVLLEIENIQYILKFTNMKISIINSSTNEYTICGDVSIDQIFDKGIHLFPEAITLTHFIRKIKYEGYKTILQRWKFYSKLNDLSDIYVTKDIYNDAIKNPILKSTPIASIIPARDVYNALDNYFRSKCNDKTITISNTDIQKAENAGFDRKSSFRHPVK